MNYKEFPKFKEILEKIYHTDAKNLLIVGGEIPIKSIKYLNYYIKEKPNIPNILNINFIQDGNKYIFDWNTMNYRIYLYKVCYNNIFYDFLIFKNKQEKFIIYTNPVHKKCIFHYNKDFVASKPGFYGINVIHPMFRQQFNGEFTDYEYFLNTSQQLISKSLQQSHQQALSKSLQPFHQQISSKQSTQQIIGIPKLPKYINLQFTKLKQNYPFYYINLNDNVSLDNIKFIINHLKSFHMKSIIFFHNKQIIDKNIEIILFNFNDFHLMTMILFEESLIKEIGYRISLRRKINLDKISSIKLEKFLFKLPTIINDIELLNKKQLDLKKMEFSKNLKQQLFKLFNKNEKL
jgi:hypothetical protein